VYIVAAACGQACWPWIIFFIIIIAVVFLGAALAIIFAYRWYV